MRPRRSFLYDIKEIDLNKPICQYIKEFLDLFNPINDIKIKNQQQSTTTDSTSILNKIEFLKNFLKVFKIVFNNQSTNVSKFISNEDKLKFKNELNENCQQISTILLVNLIQSESNQLRLFSLRFILYLTHFKNYYQQFQTFNISLYIIRIIDLDLSIEETTLSIEYIRIITQLYPSSLSKSIIYCLISSIEDSKFKLNNFMLETLLEIVCKRPKLACECNVFNELINYIQNACQENEFCSQVIVQCLIKVADDPECRALLKLEDLFSQLISPFIDIEYVPLTYGPSYNQRRAQEVPGTGLSDNNAEVSNEPKYESILNSCICALNTLMKSYNGIMCLSINDGKILKNLLTPLKWFLEANKREADKHITLRESLATQLSSLSISLSNQPKNKKNPKDQITSRQLVILNCLIDFFYKLFNLEEINTQDLIDKAYKSTGRSASVSTTNSNFYQTQVDLIDDDFVNLECDQLFDSIENYSSQSNINNLADEHKLTIFSTSPNLTICYRAFLLKIFIEAGLFEALLDLYFGLPVSFLQNYPLLVKYPNISNLICQYEILSLKTLNLFAELYYLANMLLYNEYCIDDFASTDINSSPYSSNKSIYNEMKKLSLISYLKKLNFLEREKEIITYITEFNSRKEMTKNGLQLPTDQVVKLSFFSQQFLANSSFLTSKKFQVELEILNQSMLNQKNETFSFSSVSIFDWFNKEKVKAKGSKQKLLDLEKKFDEQLDLTLVLQIDSNLAQINDQKQMWNWLEIVKLFELFLLTKSSMHPRFSPTQDSILISSNKKKILFDNQKFSKFIKKIFEFFIINESGASQLSSSPTQNYLNNSRLSYSSSSHLNQQTNNLNNLIACCGCYLIDFIINDFNLANLDENALNKYETNKLFTSYESLLFQFINYIKLHLLNEYSNIKTNSSSRVSLVSLSNRAVTKDSPLAVYILLIAHLTSTSTGDFLLENYKIYDSIIKTIDIHKDLGFMKLVVSSFNFYQSQRSRLILEKCLCITNIYNPAYKEFCFSYNEFKMYTLKLILNLFRANNLKFEAFYLDILLKSLFVFDNEVISNINGSNELKSSTEIVFEMTLNLIEYFINLRPDFVDTLVRANREENLIKQIEKLLHQNSILSSSNIFKTKIQLLVFRLRFSEFYLNQLSKEEIQNYVNEWYDLKLNHKYYQLIERYLFNANAINTNYLNELDDRLDFNNQFLLNEESSFKQTDSNKVSKNSETIKRDVKLYRRLNDQNKNYTIYLSNQAQTYLPFHLNTAIIRCKLFLENNFHLNDTFDNIMIEQLELIKRHGKLENAKVDKNLKKLKSALWSISSICICEDGFKYISKLSQSRKIFKNLFEFICLIIKITEEHPSLSIGSTCYLCLNLISKSCTGANLMGKLGWHTFQPNRFTPARAFYSLLSSLSSEEQDLSVYSSIETAVVLYNLNRNKSNLNLKQIEKYFYCDLSNYEMEFLSKISMIDLANKEDTEFIKLYDTNKIGVNFENLSVPIRINLLSVDRNLNFLNLNSITDSFDDIKELAIKEKDNVCKLENCFYCYLYKQELFKDLKIDETSETNRIKLEILTSINNLVPMINFEKSKLKKLIDLKRANSDKFDFCLFYLVSLKYLSCFKIKFHLRKFIQELFINILPYT